MKNIDFGNYLTKLREENGYTQKYIAYLLGVSDKTVSKWEMGNSIPNYDKLNSLSVLYNVSIEELLNSQSSKKDININKIVLTGGPCAGKTTALTWISNYFSKRGYVVLNVNETATELIIGGVAPWSCSSSYKFQSLLAKLQKEKEIVYEEAAKSMDSNKILIVCDRGMLDNKAYMSDIEFRRLLKEFNTNEIKERDSYDAVFHLVTAAKGAEKYYTVLNNEARTEGINEALKIDDKIITSWTGHPHFRIIDNNCDFEEKLEKLIKEIAVFLGEPEPFEIERKYLIYMPNLKELDNMNNCTKVDITQTYLKYDDVGEKRVRARGINGNYMYYLTEKKKVSDIKRVEVEKRLTQDEYLELLMEADTNLHTIHKSRYCLSSNNQYFEIDIYPEWNKQAIMEIELSSEDDKVNIPDFIKIIKEVTEDDTYKNYNMAKEMPKQLVKKR